MEKFKLQKTYNTDETGIYYPCPSNLTVVVDGSKKKEKNTQLGHTIHSIALAVVNMDAWILSWSLGRVRRLLQGVQPITNPNKSVDDRMTN